MIVEPRENLAVESERRLLSLVFGMEVSDAVLPVEHPDHDAEERRDYRHVLILLPPLLTPALTRGPRRARALPANLTTHLSTTSQGTCPAGPSG